MYKFLIISRRLDPTLSAPKCSYNLALALAKLGMDVEILTSIVSLPKSDLERLESANVKVVKVPRLFAQRALSPALYTIVAKAYKDDRIVIGHGYTFGEDITWVHFLRLGTLKYLSSFLNNHERIRMRIEGYVEKLIFKSSKKLWAVSSLVKTLLSKSYKIPENKVFVLHNGVDIEKYRPLNEQERVELRKTLNIPEDVKVLMFVGGDPFRKGFQRIIYALRKLEERFRGKNYILFAIGFEPSLDIRKASSGLRIRFLGKVHEEELIKYYQASDFLVLPSYFDPFSLVVLEAMACGTIPIVTSTVGASEIIAHGENGFIVHNDLELFEVLSNVDDVNIRRLREKAVSTARTYSWIDIAKKLLKLHNSG